MDFCCKGNRTITEVCHTIGIHEEIIIAELKSFDTNLNPNLNNFKAMSLDALIDYIVTRHYTYIKEKIPIIKQFLNKICEVHGTKNPELIEIRKLFIASANYLVQYINKEELILFPISKQW
ncbi:DUF542 domain-containing protein [Flavobacterium davisii]|uniref:DUF542 domain-containing protein n=2 Tax=Flavobacterium TaxID=237 RepID=A0A8G0KYH5_9FLAO|nr:DUF542 domain-containing protein [Flavobacterium davisii]